MSSNVVPMKKEAKVITYGIQKGGCSKSTTTCITAHFLKEEGYKVLVIDMDCQGNSTEMLMQESAEEIEGRTVLEAIFERNAKDYIIELEDNLHLLGANNMLITLVDFYYTNKTYNGEKYYYKTHKFKMLDETIKDIKGDYDYILIDTPPNLGTETSNALYASSHVVVMYESSAFCYSAIPNFMETVQMCMAAGNTDLTVAGILRTLSDGRRNDMKAFADIIEDDYPDLVFEKIIRRSATVGRLSLNGFEDNPELNEALGQHKEYYKELLLRVGEEKEVNV